jgi:hypothetical protein
MIEKLNKSIENLKIDDDKYLNKFEDYLINLNYIVLGGQYYFDENKIVYKNIVQIKEAVTFISMKLASTNRKDKSNKAEVANKESNDNKAFNYEEIKKTFELVDNFTKTRKDYLKKILNKDVGSDKNNGVFSYFLPEFISGDTEREFKTKDNSQKDEAKRVTFLNKMLRFNIALAEEDEALSCGALQIDKLIRIKKSLELLFKDETSSSEENIKKVDRIKNILFDKIEFLKKKISLRERMCEDDEFSYKDKKEYERIYERNGENEVNDNHYDAFYAKSVELYLEKKIPYQQRPIEKRRFSDGQVYFNSDEEYDLTSCEDVWKWSRHLRKRLKDDSLPHDEAISDVDMVLKVMENRINELEKVNGGDKIVSFESFAYRSTYNLLFNTSIKIILKKEIIENFKNCLNENANNTINDITFIRDIFNKIKDKQDDLRIYDYHPYQTLLKFFQDFTTKVREDVFCLGIEKDKLDEKNEVESTKKIEGKIKVIGKLYEDAIKLFQKNLKWCKSKKWNPIYLEKKSSIIEYDSETTLFMDSSFVLPDNFAKIEETWYAEDQYRMVTLRSTKNRAQFEIHRIVTESSVDRKKEEFEKKVKENEFKVVQIVAMFVTIATFVLTNVKIFENRSLSASMAVMFAFAACMLLFNAFFKWMIRDSILVNIDVLRAGKSGIGKGKSPLRFAKFFTDYKYSFSDVIMLGLIILCGFLAGYYRKKADEQHKEDVNTMKAKVIEAYSGILDSLSNEHDEQLKKQTKIFYNIDSLRLEKSMERVIKNSIKKEYLDTTKLK